MISKMFPVLVTVCLASLAVAADRQVVIETSLKDTSCVLIDGDSLHENPEIDFFNSECPGIGGFRVLHRGGDLRSNITLVKGGTESVLRLPLAENEAVTFPFVSSDSIKWTATVKDFNTFQVTAIGFSMSGQDESEEPFKAASFDVVAKISGKKACVVGKVKKGLPGADAQALELLNKAPTLKCIN